MFSTFGLNDIIGEIECQFLNISEERDFTE